jgi:hypothetical protein
MLHRDVGKYSTVIPGRADGANPESITKGSCGSKNAVNQFSSQRLCRRMDSQGRNCAPQPAAARRPA